jgi:hypothetical protein
MSGSGVVGTARRALVAVLLGALLGGALLWGRGAAHAQAPAPAAQFAYVVMYQGWNLISPGGQNDISTDSLTSELSGALFTLQPGDKNYEQTTLDKVTPGQGYWAYFNDKTTVALDPSDIDSTTVSLAANSCVMVGNPSTRGSAQVLNADHVYEFEPAENQYITTTLISIGHGALACNDARSSVVSVAYVGDVITPTWPGCCSPTASNQQGQVLLVFRNDSPAPITVAFRQMDDNGGLLDPGVRLVGEIDGCNSCPEYDPATHSCAAAAVTRSFTEPPGFYHLSIQSDDPNVPDLIADVTVTANTQYSLCYFVDATRPQKSLPPGP